jgi:fumarate reductase subunit D
MIIVRLICFIAGISLVVFTLFSAIRSFVLPRSAPDPITRFVFVVMRRIFNFRLRWAQTYEQQDQVMALYAPFSLLALLPTWLSLVAIGYASMFWALGIRPWGRALIVSGSSLLTLGFAAGDTLGHTILAFTEATLGLLLVALLIAYLPTMYNAFSRREVAVNLLRVRAGTPASAIEMILRFQRIGGFTDMGSSWEAWETWFAELEESHTSLAPLVFFRSPYADQSWVTASGVVLDAAALTLAALDLPFDPRAALCIRAGFQALRRVADFFRFPYNPDPHYPADSISITRAEFDAACKRLAGGGVPLKDDLDQAWLDFAGWRVNYDAVLIALCALTMAPKAPWSSDRAPGFAPTLFMTRSESEGAQTQQKTEADATID